MALTMSPSHQFAHIPAKWLHGAMPAKHRLSAPSVALMGTAKHPERNAKRKIFCERSNARHPPAILQTSQVAVSASRVLPAAMPSEGVMCPLVVILTRNEPTVIAGQTLL